MTIPLVVVMLVELSTQLLEVLLANEMLGQPLRSSPNERLALVQGAGLLQG